jgi:uncharacterized protein YecE (DUF72 family)
VNAVRIGCSGWNYADWRERFYPRGMPPRRWLAHYAGFFDTVEVNATFYRLTKPAVVQAWIDETPDDFVFAVKGSRYLTHMKRLTDTGQGIDRFYAAIEPLVGHPKLGPVLWQLPPNFHRDDERLAGWLDRLPPGRHTVEFRHASWYVPEVLELLRSRGAALAIGDHPKLPDTPLEVTTDWSFVRLHHSTRGRRGNYSEGELREWAERIAGLRERAEVFVYLNNDWEGFAIRNALRMRALLDA